MIERALPSVRSPRERPLRARALAATIALSCGDAERHASSAAPSAAAASAELRGSAAASVAASSQGAAAPAARHPLAGAWSGEYGAKKVKPSLDKGVKEKTWEKDDGTASAGKGTIEITVAPDGTVTGRVLGPLGPGALSGWADDKGLAAALVPESSAADAMAGTLSVEQQSASLVGSLQASSGSAEIAREASVRLERAP